MLCVAASCGVSENRNVDWPEYLGGTDRNHYSPLSQVHAGNINKLEIAWTFHTGEPGEMQCSPIMAGKTLYGVTALNQLFALDAETGAERWRFAPDTVRSAATNRGVAYWSGGGEARILFAHQSWLYAVDAKTGKPVSSFGANGRVSLRAGLGPGAADKYVVSTTPGTVYKNTIIMPIRVGEGAGAAPGYIQAFDVQTGRLTWVFHTIPHPGEKGYGTWPGDAWKDPAIGGANNWAGMALDKKRGIVYIPTGSPAFDFYGGNRKGANLFGNCILALNAENGNYIWHFQTVRHDLWDRDLPAPPNLLTIKKDHQLMDVVAQVTKSGYVYVLDRDTGQPVFPIDEVAAPASVMEGEAAWPTQPIPRLPGPFARQRLTDEDITRFSDKRDSLLTVFQNSNKGAFHPLEFKNTLLFPGADGGAEWGGAGVSPDGILYINANEMAWSFSLSRKKEQAGHAGMSGRILYNNNCAACHRPDLAGNPGSGYPSLQALNSRMKKQEVLNIMKTGRGMMPGFTTITDQQKQAIIGFLWGQEKTEAADDIAVAAGGSSVPYEFNGYNKFLDENGLPAITPPWGTLTAIDLNTGQHNWQVPLGETASLKAKGIPATGTENYGGPLVTAGGLLFIAATKDAKFRAFDCKTGKLLWEFPLPAAGFATPVTYAIDGKQYIVIACGGTKLGTAKGDVYIAFSLPREK
ncbi:outer membrane protein assembly factor BamB family protein [Niabella drilacis]|uniref:Quinoprotein glucose dehydrogenase n=1 Tax=Niabella drilacis (strain DSM 25811 / CCM 8410 / CCUG 62505 / LMG 26954 / E90) TaxID=1285928 RepID=A0A1G6RHZ1_NIADE|nr:PQQ-binding-like beta-propeller repeat protein [Niabella drilacis]SDD04242.1 quinoprotein glucose dehydrogenase [Niabella drilacis]